MYRKRQYIQGSVLPMVPDIHWESWDVTQIDKEGLLYTVQTGVIKAFFNY